MGERIAPFGLPAVLVAAALPAPAARGSLIASGGTIGVQQVGPDSYTYSMTLSVDPASTEHVASFWFAWIPQYDLLPSHATAIGSPAGWTGIDAPDTYGVASGLWSTDTAAIEPGQSLSGFTWTTLDTPDTIIGAISEYETPAFPVLPVLESYVYRYPDARGDYEAFVPTTPVPEPGSLVAAVALGLLPLACRRRYRHR